MIKYWKPFFMTIQTFARVKVMFENLNSASFSSIDKRYVKFYFVIMQPEFKCKLFLAYQVFENNSEAPIYKTCMAKPSPGSYLDCY